MELSTRDHVERTSVMVPRVRGTDVEPGKTGAWIGARARPHREAGDKGGARTSPARAPALRPAREADPSYVVDHRPQRRVIMKFRTYVEPPEPMRGLEVPPDVVDSL